MNGVVGSRTLLWLIASAAVGASMSTGMKSWLPMFFVRNRFCLVGVALFTRTAGMIRRNEVIQQRVA